MKFNWTHETIMANIIIGAAIVIGLLLTGCATPSEDTQEYEIVAKPDGTYEPILKKRIRRWDNSTFYSGKLVGFQLSYDPDTYTPSFLLRYGRYDSGRVSKGQAYLSTFGLKDVSLIRAEGRSANTTAIFDSKYLDEEYKEALIARHKLANLRETSVVVPDEDPDKQKE